jgi:NADPH:quinone reductase-like Zn-dependent oxidoreductase
MFLIFIGSPASFFNLSFDITNCYKQDQLLLQSLWKMCFLKPEYLTWEEAAALPLAGLTAYRALVTSWFIKGRKCSNPWN